MNSIFRHRLLVLVKSNIFWFRLYTLRYYNIMKDSIFTTVPSRYIISCHDRTNYIMK